MVIHHRSFSAVGGYWPVYSVVLFFFLELSIIHATDIYVKRMLLELLNASSAQYYLKDPLCVHCPPTAQEYFVTFTTHTSFDGI